MFETALLHPALKLTAVRENGPEIYIKHFSFELVKYCTLNGTNCCKENIEQRESRCIIENKETLCMQGKV